MEGPTAHLNANYVFPPFFRSYEYETSLKYVFVSYEFNNGGWMFSLYDAWLPLIL